MNHNTKIHTSPAFAHTHSHTGWHHWRSAWLVAALACGLAGQAQSEEAPMPEPVATVVITQPTAQQPLLQPPVHHVAAESVAAAPELHVAETPLPLAQPDSGVADAAAVSAKPEPNPLGVAKRALGKSIAQGLASWYGPRFHGRRTANGERYDMKALTAAHKTLPFGTKVRVRSVHTGQEIVVRINDRGPYKHARIIDLSQAAMAALGVLHRGVSEVILLRE